MRIDLKTLPALLCFALLPGCGETSDARPAERVVRAEPSAQAPKPVPTNAPAAPSQIDPPPAPAGDRRIVEQEDVMVQGEPGCAFTVRYPGAIDQPVTWNKEACRDLTARFMSREELARLGQMDDLPAEARADLGRAANQPVFYIEGGFSASIYPLNAADRVYEVSVAD